jgi:hypothetical protein
LVGWGLPERLFWGVVVRVLRVGQWAADGGFRVDVALEGAGARRSAAVEFQFGMSAQDREDLRWYLEDFLLYPLDPAPLIAERVQARVSELGGRLFEAVFGSRDALRVWEAAAAGFWAGRWLTRGCGRWCSTPAGPRTPTWPSPLSRPGRPTRIHTGGCGRSGRWPRR